MNQPDSAPGSIPGLLETMTIEQVRAFRPQVGIIPLGSTEPHGPHLPYGTDTFINDYVTAEAVKLANAQNAGVLRLPPLPIGNNVNFKAFPFACRIRVETLMAVITDLVQFLVDEGVRKIVVFNSHGGNESTIHASLRTMHDQFQQDAFVCMAAPGAFTGKIYADLFHDGSPHAGDYETSLIQHIAPQLVVDAARKPAPMNAPAIPGLSEGQVSWVRPWHELMPASCAGRPDLATAEKGRAFLEADTAAFADFLIQLSREPWRPGFPYKSA